MNWLAAAIIALLCGVIVAGQWLHHLSEVRWMRMFAAREGFPADVIEPSAPTPAAPETPHKPSVRFAIPGAELFRKGK